jgi:hypothetical protein
MVDRLRRPVRTGLAPLLALALMAAPLGAHDDCGAALAGEGRARVESERIVVVFRTTPAPIPVGRHFSLEAAVCARSGPAPTDLRVDAHMPEHRHGMNYRASVAPRGDGRFAVEGLLFHMPGRWRLVFDVASGGQTERLVKDVIVE